MAGPGARPDPFLRPGLRLDRWLFQARFFRSRARAAALVEAGHCRVNAQRMLKPGHPVAPGDVLTFPQGDRIRVVRVLALGDRRGPAAVAQELYADLSAATSGPLE